MPYFSVLVGNLRAESDYAPDADETLVRGDRQHPILGNHGFAMKDKSLFERRRVIEAFARRLDLDTAQSGPLSSLLRDYAERARGGEKLRFQCWCSPLPCHLDVVAARVLSLAQNPALSNADLPPSGSVIPGLFLGLGPSVRAAAPVAAQPARQAPRGAVSQPAQAPASAPSPVADASPSRPAASVAGSFSSPPAAAQPADGRSRSGWGKRKV